MGWIWLLLIIFIFIPYEADDHHGIDDEFDEFGMF